jgi:arylsulfatase A
LAANSGRMAVRMGDWKGYRNKVFRDPDAPLKLFDLGANVGENRSVAAQHPDVVEAMQRIMLRARTTPEYDGFRFGRYSDDLTHKGDPDNLGQR